jgi:hypothetical protein
MQKRRTLYALIFGIFISTLSLMLVYWVSGNIKMVVVQGVMCCILTYQYVMDIRRIWKPTYSCGKCGEKNCRCDE